MDRFSVVLEKLPHHPRRRGQALIEFAMLAPLIFFLFISVADAGFCSVAAIGVQNAARVGALYTSSSSSAATDSAGACDVVRQELQALPNFSGSNSACSSAPLQVTAQKIDSGVGGTPIASVTVTYRTIPLIPVPLLYSGPFTIVRTVQMPVRPD